MGQLRVKAVARAISVLGHPGIVMPAAVIGSAVARGAALSIVTSFTLIAIALIALVLGYSAWQIRKGAWVDMDASRPAERLQLNVFLAVVLFALAAVLAVSGFPAAFVVGTLLAGMLIVLALLLRHRLKLSLHVCFAVYGAALLWPLVAATAAGLVAAIAIGWSRLILQRHTQAEVYLGAVAGGWAGLTLHLLGVTVSHNQ